MSANRTPGGSDSANAFTRWRRKRLAKQARGWVVRLDAGGDDARRDRAFAAWLARPGAEAAFVGAAGLWLEIDRAALSDRVEAARLLRWKPRPVPAAGKRAAGLALAASIAALAWWGPGMWIALSADVKTGAFETRRIALDDGSAIVLASNSAVDIQYRKGERRVRLLEGEAAFSVARDPARPFVVAAGGGETRALGTRFLTAFRGGGVTVTGVHHRIRVTADGGARELGPGEAVHYGRFSAPGTIAADHYAGGWQRGLVIVENRSLADIAAELARYSDRPIWVLGAARSRAFSGTFRIADPVAGLRAAARTARLRVTELPGMVLVTAR
ncbi:MAG: FecR domain-containing protein [Candidatus Andeanibacterium colombiense]|uniref:FecR domain-containing protein n=1 Tax=Candidatus Andeanibacterium colombiense TaxID=3121345 RepID=A0AAJ5X607_9SPHN|nr:MAG: FecR domain-containing protein [Sphingomonadaceae bacterium]